jgi:threonine/homoserine/homoserine lactone efflux protein
MIGLTIAAPIGPMAVLCINRTLNAGLIAGISTGAGASTVQLGYCSVVLFGLREAAPWLETNRGALSLFGAALMLLFAWRMLRPGPGLRRRRTRLQCGSALHNYVSAVLFNSVNPMLLILLISAVAAVIGTERPEGHTIRLILTGLCLGSMSWWVALSVTAASVRGRLSRDVLRLVNNTAALSLLGFGVIALSRALGG